MLKLYDATPSGNCHKARLMLSLLNLEHELIPVNLKEGEQKSAEFLKLNPFGQVPVLTDGEVVIRDAQAILVYLARCYGGEAWLPTEPESMAKVMQWLSTAANDIQNSLAQARKYYLLNANVDVEQAQQKAHQVLQIIDKYLQGRDWLECDRPTIADIACYPYIGLASQGKVTLDGYANIIAWIERIQKLPGYVGMPGL